MVINTTKVTAQESPFGGTWSYTVLVESDRDSIFIPGMMGYDTYNDAIEAGVKYAKRLREANK